MRIALVQMEITQGDVERNLGRMDRFLGRAAKAGADVAVFPEYCVSGSVRGHPELIDGAGKCRRALSALARGNGIDLVPGTFVERSGTRAYNTALYIDRSGRILGSYRKINLWHSERGHLAPGRTPAVFDTRFGRAGLAVCWDLTYPELFRSMSRMGARVIFVPSFWSDAGISNRRIEARNIDNLCAVRAFENECAVAYANAAGVYKEGDTLVGHSQLVLPIEGAVKKAAHNRETMLLADVPAGALERAARVYKIRSDILKGYPR